jgi:hypothetical protein
LVIVFSFGAAPKGQRRWVIPAGSTGGVAAPQDAISACRSPLWCIASLDRAGHAAFRSLERLNLGQ